MIKFSKENVLLLHQLMAESTGGGVSVRDDGLLDSALESAFASFDGKDLYPSKEEKAARIGFSLVEIMHLSTAINESAFTPCYHFWK